MSRPAVVVTDQWVEAVEQTLDDPPDGMIHFTFHETVRLRLDGWTPTVTWPGHE